MEFKKLSIKNFIGDLPNIINFNFEIIKTFFNDLFVKYDDTVSLHNIHNIETTKIDCTTIQVSNVLIKKENGSLISLNGYIKECIEDYIKNNDLVK